MACLCGFILFSHVAAQTSTVPSKATPEMFRKGFDIPAGIPHGTWDFDEWPGIDHPVVYKSDYMYNSTPSEKVKIDYFLSVFDKDDHEGYLKTPEELVKHGFVDMDKLVKSGVNGRKTMLGIFSHPDDEVLLCGGLLAYAINHGWNVSVILVSNGADGSKGQKDVPSEAIQAFNSVGIMPNGQVVVKTDAMAEEKNQIVKDYGSTLGADIEILSLDMMIAGKKVGQIGEQPGLDFPRTFGPESEIRMKLKERLAERIGQINPSIVLTHGRNGEYANYLHKTVHDLMTEILADKVSNGDVALFTCFPEYNYDDNITHFLDLYRENKVAWQKKWDTFKAIPFLYEPGKDFDKPWDPNDTLLDGVFVKDYGYTPETAEPPRYEFFHSVRSR